MPFEASKPISKIQFLANSKECIELCQLALAPFGTPTNVDLYSGITNQETYQAYYHQWEEIFSRHIYKQQGVPDDQVAASFHEYIEIEKDNEIMDVVQSAAKFCANMYQTPMVVDLGSACSSSLVDTAINTPEFTSILLSRVLSALIDLAKACQLLTSPTHILSIDDYSWLKYKVSVPLKPFPATQIFTNEEDKIPQTLKDLLESALSGFQNALNFNSSDSDVAESSLLAISTDVLTWQVRARQYHALLEIYGDSEAVRTVLIQHGLAQSDSIYPLHNLRIGRVDLASDDSSRPSNDLASLCASLCFNPAAQFLMQLDVIVCQTMQTPGREEIVVAFENTIERIQKALTAQNLSKHATDDGKSRDALDLIQEVLQPSSVSENEGDNVLVPTYLQNCIELQRAYCTVLLLGEGNLKDEDEVVENEVSLKIASEAISGCNRVIVADPGNNRARALRGQLLKWAVDTGRNLSSVIAQLKLEDCGTSSNSSSSKLLRLAIRDSLAAYLLSGNSDMESAARAEEYAREACRNEAKLAFEEKTRLAESLNLAPASPKDWTMRAFFMGHPPLSVNLSVDIHKALESLEPATGNENNVSNTNGINTIDDDSVESNRSPPLYLLDPITLSDTNCVPGPGTSTTTYRCLHSGDNHAYQLVLQLVGLIDGMWLSQSSSVLVHETSEQLPTNSTTDFEENIPILTQTEAVDSLENLLEFCGQIQIGQLSLEPDGNFVRVPGRGYLNDVGEFELRPISTMKSDADQEIDELIKSCQRLTVDKLRNCNEATAAVTSIAYTSPIFSKAMELLSSPTAAKLTGVKFSADGKVLSVSEVARLSKLPETKVDNLEHDDDTVWEDCDTDDEADNEDGDSEKANREVKTVDFDNQNESLLLTEEDLNLILCSHVSQGLKARLQVICSSLCYLAGDAISAVRCLRSAMTATQNTQTLTLKTVFRDLFTRLQDGPKLSDNAVLIECDQLNRNSKTENDKDCSSKEALLLTDIRVKLGSLLADMDEENEANELLEAALKSDSRNASALVHLAEQSVQGSDFETAIEILSQAKEIVVSDYYYISRDVGNTSGEVSGGSGKSNRAKDSLWGRRAVTAMLAQEAHSSLTSTVYALLALALFRLSPTNPEASMKTVKEGLGFYPKSTYLLLCMGEIYCQLGDAVSAMSSFKDASVLMPQHPLPYLNAARVYQQLNQRVEARRHTEIALTIDPDLAMTRIDLAQHYLHLGRPEEALDCLQTALRLARHVSEIKDVLTAQLVAMVQMDLQKEIDNGITAITI